MNPANTDYIVVIPSRNRYELLLRAVRSTLAQTVQPTEVVVIDDASTDRRYDWVEEIINSPRLTMIRQAVPSQVATGQGFAVGHVRNAGLEHVRHLKFDGWVAFLDDDDEWFPTKAEAQLAAARQYDEVWAFCSNALNRNLEGQVCGYHHGPHGRQLSSNYRDVTQCLKEFNPVINSTGILHTYVANKIGGQKPAGFGEDFDYWRRASKLTPVVRIDEPLAYYTVGNQKEYRVG